MTPLERLDAAPAAEVESALLACCGSRRWVAEMTALHPFGTAERLMAEAERVWWALDPSDWLEAFRSHPRIGERGGGQQSERGARWSRGEQAAATDAAAATLAALAEGNRAYEARFGYLFIVCATGRSADEMLDILRTRLGNDPETELRVAAGEQLRITRLRLEKLLSP